MKKGTIILGSIIGGAVLGTALTLCITSEKGKEMRRMAHEKIMEHLAMIQEHMQGCNCSTGGESKMAQMEESVKEKMGEMKEKMGNMAK